MDKSCPRCEKRVEYTDVTCDACGLEFPQAPPPKCPGCNRTVHPDSDSCGFCGLELRAPSSGDSSRTATINISFSTLMWPALAVLLFVVYGNRDKITKLIIPSGPGVVRAQGAASGSDADLFDDFSDDAIGQVMPTSAKMLEAFKVEGEIYDIRTLEPIGGASILFKNMDSNEFFGAETNSSGRYSAWLEPDVAGYIVTIAHNDYSTIYMEDCTPSLRLLPAHSRRYVIIDIIENPPQKTHIFGMQDQELTKSFAVVPR